MRTRFLMLDGEPRALTTRVQYVNGTHRAYRVLFSTDGPEEVLREQEWKRLLTAGRVHPIAADETIEDLSDRIGKPPDRLEDAQPLTPQDALNRALTHLRYTSIGEEMQQTGELPEARHE